MQEVKLSAWMGKIFAKSTWEVGILWLLLGYCKDWWCSGLRCVIMGVVTVKADSGSVALEGAG